MKRCIYKDLLRWKESPDRKPLVLEGARQVGKTWILKEFGSNEYKNVAYVNCDNNPLLEELFIDFDIDRIIKQSKEWDEFLKKMVNIGYEIKYSKHIDLLSQKIR